MAKRPTSSAPSERTATRIPLERLRLDPANPRIGFSHGSSQTQPELVRIMWEDFVLDELIESFLVSGFFASEPLVGVESDGGTCTVVEGNRRLAALLILSGAAVVPAKIRAASESEVARFNELSKARRQDLVNPWVFVAESRLEVLSYIGFRHVTGIKQWPALEKAGYIAHMVDDHGLSTFDVANMIGSKPHYVAKHYQAHRLLEQCRDEGIDIHAASEQFGVFMRALEVEGVRDFIKVPRPQRDLDDTRGRKIVTRSNRKPIEEFMALVFGKEGHPPLFTDSRQLTKFGRILRSETAMNYVRDYPKPSFEQAYFLSGGETEETRRSMQVAAHALRDCVAISRRMKKDREFSEALGEVCDYLEQILRHFPVVRARYFSEDG